jgi:8-hydroxy-5-deazaflavin:NADPH oxidoreductase
MAEFPPPPEGIVLAHFIVSDDVERSRRFYTEVLGGRVAYSGPGGLTYVALSNSWIIINVGGGPTDDKPTVTLETPRNPDRVSSFLNIRVKDIEAVYAEWSARGAQFLTPPKQHQYEIRCYIRDPDGHLIEVGQTTDPAGTGRPLTGHRVRPPRSRSECRHHLRLRRVSFVTTAIIGTEGIGSAIARQLASDGDTLRLSSADNDSARTLAAKIGRAAVVAADNRDAVQGADAVVRALRFTVLKGVIDQIADPLTGKLVVVPSNPLSTDAHGNVTRVLPEGQSSGKVVAGWLPTGARLAMAFGTMSADLFESSSHRSPVPAVLFYVTDDDRAGQEVERLIRTAGFEPVKAGGLEQSGRLEVGGDLHDLVVAPAQARSLVGGSRVSSDSRREHSARVLPGQSPRQCLDEVAEISTADRVVERAGAVGEQLAGYGHALRRDRAGRG